MKKLTEQEIKFIKETGWTPTVEKCDEWEKNHPKMAEQYIWHLSEMIGAFLM